jgi:hypothetical protein
MNDKVWFREEPVDMGQALSFQHSAFSSQLSALSRVAGPLAARGISIVAS